MTGAAVAGGASIAVGDLLLIAICWRRRAVLAGVLGAAGIPLAVFAIASGPTVDGPEGTLAIALALLIIGVGLYGIGQLLERVLDEGPDEEA
ncbi:MAG TPA: hypothetical protein VGH78_04245 [Solirubrobacteraceae bacterium]|jgi:hypothetical protein